MKINHISQAYGLEIQKGSGNAKNIAKAEKGVSSDTVSVSKAARKLSHSSSEIQTATRQITGMPDIRADKVDEVKLKVAEGFYNTPEFTDKLAESLVKEFGFPS